MCCGAVWVCSSAMRWTRQHHDAKLSAASHSGAALAEGSHVSFPRTSLLGYAYSFVRHPLLRIGVWGLVAVMAGDHTVS